MESESARERKVYFFPSHPFLLLLFLFPCEKKYTHRVDPFAPDAPIKSVAIETFPPDVFFVLRVIQVRKKERRERSVFFFSFKKKFRSSSASSSLTIIITQPPPPPTPPPPTRRCSAASPAPWASTTSRSSSSGSPARKPRSPRAPGSRRAGPERGRPA